MGTGYDLNEHIQPIDLGLAASSLADQREVTIQVFETSLAFDRERLVSGLGEGRLTRVLDFGLIQFLSGADDDDIRAVLALQGEVRIRTYDEETERVHWWSWDRAIKDTVAIRYSADDDGMLRFTTFGGGTRISRGRIADFHTATIGLPSANARPIAIDPVLMRERCFEDRFLKRLYSIRGQVGAEGYETIDQTAFKSREYMDPGCQRLQELQDDAEMVVEAFVSEVDVKAPSITGEITARFEVRSTSGSIRIRFPRIPYSKQLSTVQAQSQAFYDLAERTVTAIAGQGLHTVDPVDPADLDTEDQEFPEFVDTAAYRKYVGKKTGRDAFFAGLDLYDEPRTWLPHLRALNELLATEGFAPDLSGLLREQLLYEPDQSVHILEICRRYTLANLGGHVYGSLLAGLLQLPTPTRSRAELAVLNWSADHDAGGWDVTIGDDVMLLRGVAFPVSRIEYRVRPHLLIDAMAAVHGRLLEKGASEEELTKIGWCVRQLASLPSGIDNLPAVVPLLQRDAVPTTVDEAGKLIGERLDGESLDTLERVVLEQVRLPLWPVLEVVQDDAGLKLLNHGPGTAMSLRLEEPGEQKTLAFQQDLRPGHELVVEPRTVSGGKLRMRFRKFGAEHSLALSVPGARSRPETQAVAVAETGPALLGMQELRALRRDLDPGDTVVGASEATYRVFESIHLANRERELKPVLLTGETGVGKSHVAALIHASSDRREGPFRRIAGGSGTGGDATIQRGEWIGFGPGSGVNGIPRDGKPGYVQSAEGGTLFIDDFETISGEVQALLLTVMEGLAVDLVGGRAYAPDVRCIFATNRELAEAVKQGAIRNDLLARIATKIEILPLRERLEDVLLLGRHFASEGGSRLSPQAEIALLRHRWPENTRELRFTIERAIAAAGTVKSSRIEPAHLTQLPEDIRADAGGIDDDSAATELWQLANRIALQEGYRLGGRGRGLQKRVGEIMGVQQAQASRMYKKYVATDS